MLYSALLYLLRREAVVLSILLQRFKISAVGSVLGCFLSCHRSAVTVYNNTVSSYDWHLVYCLSVILHGNHVRYQLGLLVVFIVSVVDSLAFLIQGETFTLLISVVGIMRRSKTVCLDYLIVSLNLSAVSQCTCALIAYNAQATLKLLPSNPYITYFTYRTYVTYTTYLLHSSLDLILSHYLLDIGVKLQFLLGSLNSHCLLNLSFLGVVQVTSVVHLYLLGILQHLLGSLYLSVHSSLSILAKLRRHPFRTLLCTHLRVVSSLTTFRILHHRHRRTVRKGSYRFLFHRRRSALNHRLSRA